MKYSSCCDIENGANSDFCHFLYYRVYCPSRVFPVKKYARYHSPFFPLIPSYLPFRYILPLFLDLQTQNKLFMILLSSLYLKLLNA